MFLLIHISLALISLFFSTLAYVSPSKARLSITYFSGIFTVISGAGLIYFNEANLSRVCITGIFYLAIVFYLSKAANKRLSVIESHRGKPSESY